MINLKTEEFVLEMNTLQSLQQLIQWVGDFVLYLLASLPNQVRAWASTSSLLCTPQTLCHPLQACLLSCKWNSSSSRLCLSPDPKMILLFAGLSCEARPQLPAGRSIPGHVQGADGGDPYLGAAEAKLPPRLHSNL